MAPHASGSGLSSKSIASGTVNGKRKAPGGNKNSTQNKPARKKGNASSSVLGSPDLEITKENMSFYKAMEVKLKAAAALQDEGKLLWITTSCFDYMINYFSNLSIEQNPYGGRS